MSLKSLGSNWNSFERGYFGKDERGVRAGEKPVAEVRERRKPGRPENPREQQVPALCKE